MVSFMQSQLVLRFDIFSNATSHFLENGGCKCMIHHLNHLCCNYFFVFVWWGTTSCLPAL